MTPQQIHNFLEAGMVADALGVPVEFSARDSYVLTQMQGFGTYDEPAGSWSDDSSLTLCLAETLVEGGDADALMQKFVAYMQAGAYTPGGHLFDIGNATRQAVIDYAVNHRPATKAGSRSPWANGNGALMRIAPTAVALREQPLAMRVQAITDFTTVTHGHVRAIIASVWYCETLRAAFAGAPLAQALAAAWQTVVALGYPEAELALFAPLSDPGWRETPRAAIKSDGYVVDTLGAAIWCALNGDSLAAVSLTAANLGDDTDTVAQIAASLYAAAHLDEKQPAAWRDALIDSEQATRIRLAFAARFAG